MFNPMIMNQVGTPLVEAIVVLYGSGRMEEKWVPDGASEFLYEVGASWSDADGNADDSFVVVHHGVYLL